MHPRFDYGFGYFLNPDIRTNYWGSKQPWTQEKTETKYKIQLALPWSMYSTTWLTEPFKPKFIYESISDNFKSIFKSIHKIGQQVKF